MKPPEGMYQTATKLRLITEIARTDRKCKFNNLAHLLNIKNFKECFRELKRGKAT